jgi:cytidyltransferase-like protein
MVSGVPVMVWGGFDDPRSREVRFLQEASRWGEVTVGLWSDEECRRRLGREPRLRVEERRYFVEALRYVVRAVVLPPELGDVPVALAAQVPGGIWVDLGSPRAAERAAWAQAHGLGYREVLDEVLGGLPVVPAVPQPGRKRVVVTGCYDWLHTGHVRFFEEVSALGELHVVVGHDANIRLLKGAGHPLVRQEERCYLVGSIRHVSGAWISSGEGWLDADPEIRRIQPDMYVVNEDGDRGGKREYCRARGIEYRVLKREPARGLPRRSSTELRGY